MYPSSLLASLEYFLRATGDAVSQAKVPISLQIKLNSQKQQPQQQKTHTHTKKKKKTNKTNKTMQPTCLREIRKQSASLLDNMTG